MSEKIGGNHPPFDPEMIVDLTALAQQLRETYVHLFTEQAGLVAAAKKWLEEHVKGVLDDDDMAAATEQVAQLLTVLDAYHGKPASAHTKAKEPFLKGGRIVDEVMNVELAGPIREAADSIKKPMHAYADAKRKRMEQEAKDLAAKQAAEAIARQAALTSKSTDEDLFKAMEAEQEAVDAAARAATPMSKASQVRGDLGGMSNLRGKWKARIVNEDLVPRSLMMPNMEAIELKMNQSKDKKTGVPVAVIPGVEIFLDTTLSIRK